MSIKKEKSNGNGDAKTTPSQHGPTTPDTSESSSFDRRVRFRTLPVVHTYTQVAEWITAAELESINQRDALLLQLYHDDQAPTEHALRGLVECPIHDDLSKPQRVVLSKQYRYTVQKLAQQYRLYSAQSKYEAWMRAQSDAAYVCAIK